MHIVRVSTKNETHDRASRSFRAVHKDVNV